MATLIITEKTSQAKDLRAAFGDRYGQILPAEGHLLRLTEPDARHARAQKKRAPAHWVAIRRASRLGSFEAIREHAPGKASQRRGQAADSANDRLCGETRQIPEAAAASRL